MTVTLVIDIPETGDMAPADGMPSAEEVREQVEYLFKFTDATPWYADVSLVR